MEVSFVLQNYLNVDSKIIRVERGDEMNERVREIINHFNKEGTPIMIGGGVLAHTILGVDFNESTGDSMLLVLDPHYTGVDDIKTIQDKVHFSKYIFEYLDSFVVFLGLGRMEALVLLDERCFLQSLLSVKTKKHILILKQERKKAIDLF